MAVSMAAVMSVLVMVSNSLVDVAFSSVVEVQRNDAACLTRPPPLRHLEYSLSYTHPLIIMPKNVETTKSTSHISCISILPLV